MPTLMTVFVDGLRPDALDQMPFLGSLPAREALIPELGYSVTCHASIYTGVRPDKHLQWFVWRHSPASSPFRWVARTPLPMLPDNLPVRVLANRATRKLVRNSSFFGIPLLANLPLREWPRYDVVEKKLWCEPGYMETFPTLFDIARSNDIPMDIHGMDPAAAGHESSLVRRGTIRPDARWVMLFFGDVDHASHRHGQFSPEGRAALRRVDEAVAAKHAELSRRDEVYLLCFSDHGHTLVRRRVDLEQHFRARGARLHSFRVLVEANYARFWLRSDDERSTLERVFADFDGGHILSDDELGRYRVTMPDNRYGDLIFYLDEPAVFARTAWGFSRTLTSAHGFLPEHPSSHGVVASNRPLRFARQPHVVDIAPTVLGHWGLPIPSYMDGSRLWEAGR